MQTILEILTKGAAFLKKNGIEKGRFEMECMVAHVLKMNRMDLYINFEQPLNKDKVDTLRDWTQRRAKREPLQHILGEVSFYNQNFICDKRGLVPRPETEELVELTINELKDKTPQTILDVGCGSGVIGLSLANEYPESKVTCIDLSQDALNLAQENAKKLELEGIKFINSDLFSTLSVEKGEDTQKYDLIIANLPYVPQTDKPLLTPEVLNDPEMALFGGEDGMDIVKQFCSQVADYLTESAIVALEVGYNQGQETAQLLEQAGFTQVEVHSDLNKQPRFVIATF